MLGPLGVDVADVRPRERLILAALLVRSPATIRPEELAELAWESRPASWAHQVQSAVSRIRSAIGSQAVRTSLAGYAIDRSLVTTDAEEFESGIASARDCVAIGEHGRAVSAYRLALSQWTGDPLPELIGWPERDVWAARLAALRADAEEELVAQRLVMGDHHGAQPDAIRLVRENPTRERAWALLALAQYRDGRQVQALDSLRSARAALRDLGLDPGIELESLERDILRRDAGLDIPPPPVISESSPYRGLAAFSADDAGVFFGRDALALDLAELTLETPLLVLTGASGIGKSSLVHAGIIPELMRRGVTTAAIRPTRSEPSSADVLVIDQFEEAFALDDAARSRLVGIAEDALRSGTHLLVVVRPEYLAQLALVPPFADHIAQAVRIVTPMSEAQLREAIEGPATSAGLSLEPGLTALVLRDAADRPGALPHLSHALLETWQRREGSVLTVAGYESAGGISGAIARSAEAVFATFSAAQRDLCRSTLLRLVSRPDDGPPIRRAAATTMLRGDPPRRHVVDQLIAARLLTIEGVTVELAHEALATAWPRLDEWLREDAAGSRLMVAVITAAESWDAEGRGDHDLWRGPRLHRVLTWVAETAPVLSPLERAFLEASQADEIAAERRRAALVARDRRQASMLRRAFVATAVLLVAVMVTAGFLVLSSTRSSELAESSRIEALVATSLSLRDDDREVAALLAAEVYRRWPDDPRARAGLMGVVTAAGSYLGRQYFDADTIAGALVPGSESRVVALDDTRVGVSTPGGELRLFAPVPTAAGPTPAGPTSAGPTPVAVRVTADGTRAVVVAVDPRGTTSTVTRWDLSTGELVGSPVSVDRALRRTPALGASGVLYATDASTGELVAVDRDGAVRSLAVQATEGGAGSATSVGVLADARVAVGTAHEIVVVDPVRWEVVARMPVPDGASNVAIAAVGDALIASGDAGIARVDLDAAAVTWFRPFPRSQHQQCEWIAAHGDALTFFCSGRRVQEYSTDTGLPTDRLFDAGVGSAGSVEIAADGAELVAFGADSASIASWRLDGGGPVATLIAPGLMAVDGFEPHGTRIITAVPPDPGDLASQPTRWSVFDTEARAPAIPGTSGFELIAWAGTGVIDTWSGVDGEPDLLVDLATGRRRPLRLTEADGNVAGRSGAVGYSFGDGWIQAYDPATGEEVGPRMDPGGRAVTVGDTSDGEYVVAWVWSGDPIVRSVAVFDARTGHELARGLTGGNGVVPIPDGSGVIGSQANQVTISTLPDLELARVLPNPGGSASDFPQISDDGRTLLIPTDSQQVALYDPVAGISLGDRIPAVTRDYWPSGFLSPDGNRAVVNIAEGIALWDLDPDDQFAAVCRIAGRELTDVEWATYLGDEPPERTCGQLATTAHGGARSIPARSPAR